MTRFSELIGPTSIDNSGGHVQDGASGVSVHDCLVDTPVVARRRGPRDWAART